MKITIVIPIFTCAFSAASAQTTAPKTLQEIIKAQPVTASAFTNTPGKPQAQLLSVTADGKAYALPQDNMPCFVPNKVTAAVIPNAAIFAATFNRMPNASQVRPVIPVR